MERNGTVNLGGQWFLVVLMIVVVSWVIFRYLIPRSRKEWAATGVLQAFIVALYAEMYGFPLTIYILTAVCGVDIPWLHVKGHLWSTLLGLGDFGAMAEMILGYGIIGLGLWLLAAGWRTVYKAKEQGTLALIGPYRYVRHPQYMGILLAVAGQLIHWPTLPTLLLAPVLLLVYYRLARREEHEMLNRFGTDYQAYQESVPAFLPGFRRLFQSAQSDNEGTVRPTSSEEPLNHPESKPEDGISTLRPRTGG